MKKKLSKAEHEQVAALQAMSDDKIDVIDIPEAPALNWSDAKRPNLYRPLKHAVTIRLDADVLSWFKDNATNTGYQTEINRVLRNHVADRVKKRA